MEIALWVYALVYSATMATAIINDFRSKVSLFDKVCDSVLLPLGLFGIVLFVHPIRSTELRTLWQFVAPLIVAGLTLNNFSGRRHALRQTDIARDEKLVADIGTALVLVPMFVVNLLYAFAQRTL